MRNCLKRRWTQTGQQRMKEKLAIRQEEDTEGCRWKGSVAVRAWQAPQPGLDLKHHKMQQHGQMEERGDVLVGTGYEIDDNRPSEGMESFLTMGALHYLHKLQRTWHPLHFPNHNHNQEIIKKK